MRLLNRSHRPSIAVIAAAAAIVVTSGCTSTNTSGDVDSSAAGPASTTVTAQGNMVTDASDIRNLVAFATHVFTGQVQAISGTKARDQIPETQFTVTTGVSLKGEVDKTVTVNQLGGMNQSAYVSVEGDQPLKPGQWYRFATRMSSAEQWYTVIPVYGDVPITESEARDKASKPLLAAVNAMKQNPQNRLDAGVAPTPEPSLTFPIPQPGDLNPPPPSPPQPTR